MTGSYLSNWEIPEALIDDWPPRSSNQSRECVE